MRLHVARRMLLSNATALLSLALLILILTGVAILSLRLFGHLHDTHDASVERYLDTSAHEIAERAILVP